MTEIAFLSPFAEYSMADEWHRFASIDHFWMRWRFEVLKKLLPEGFTWGKTLEIGCGNGVAREQIENHYGCAVSACDLNLHALHSILPGSGQLYYYNIHDKNKQLEGRFSTIVLLDVLEHVDEPAEFLKSAAFHLEKGGNIIVNVPAFQFLYSRYDRAMGHFKRYAIASLTKEMGQAGMEMKTFTYWGLSMIPLLMVRKLVMCFIREDKIIKTGFQPGSRFLNRLLGFVGEAYSNPRMSPK